MKKSLLILLLAVLLPSLLLGWLALRSAQEQQIVLERRTAELYQKETENLATSARSLISEQRRLFAETLRQLLAEQAPAALATHFTSDLRQRWSPNAVGFALDDTGRLLSPTLREAGENPQARQFLYDNGAFLGNKTAATAYNVAMDELNRPEVSLNARSTANASANGTFSNGRQNGVNTSNSLPAGPLLPQAPLQQPMLAKSSIKNFASAAAPAPGSPPTQQQQQSFKNNTLNLDTGNLRKVAPQQQNAPPESQIVSASAEFRQFTAEGTEGVVNRFVHDRLNMIFWVRPAAAHTLIFGCLLRDEDLRPQWPGLFEPPTPAPASFLSRERPNGNAAAQSASDPDFTLALLDDKAQPVAVSPAGSKVPDWKKPFVASEIGEALPHWETALYLRHPERLQASARQVRRNLYLLIACALAAIALGGWSVAADTRHKLALAQKKTDFVSNVSHELKTPLTSIRMFAELMHSGKAAPDRQPQYLRIIMVEAERLTRLINNVLDFAQLERRERRLEKRPLDLYALLDQAWPAHEFRLRENGFKVDWEVGSAPPYPIVGDHDALEQVLVNLLGNAEKYGGERKEITLRTAHEAGWVYLSVLDRGPGVPTGQEAKIFDAFYRAHDSLSSGIPGSGLGLALVRRVINEHGGDIRYRGRPGGGADFTVRLPLASSGI